MEEKEFIYKSLRHLKDELSRVVDLVDEHSLIIGDLINVIQKMQSPEYATQLVKMAEMADVEDKIKFMRNLGKQ